MFVDDQRRNVAGALAAGMRALWFDPTDVSGSVARVRASRFDRPSVLRRPWSKWAPIFLTGLSEVMGSWKIMAISAPHSLR